MGGVKSLNRPHKCTKGFWLISIYKGRRVLQLQPGNSNIMKRGMKMKAVIMAGGKGTRLRPLTCNTPKPMVPLLNRPCMEYIIELLKRHGIYEIAVTVQYLPEVIKSYFGDGAKFGVKLYYFDEERPLGTAGSVKNAEDFLDEKTFLVISGDALTDFDLSRAIQYHMEKQAVATLVTTKVENPTQYGVVMTNDEGRIIRFLEKPSWGEVFSNIVNTGIYVLDREIFSYFDKGVEFDFSKNLFPLLMSAGRPLYGYVADGYWSDIGCLSEYRRAQFDMLDSKVKVDIEGEQIAPRIWVGKNVRINEDVEITGPAYIGENSILAKGVKLAEYTIIGKHNNLRKNVSVCGAVLWDYNYVEQGSALTGANIGSQVMVSQGVTIHEEAVIGDRCTLGQKIVIEPSVKVFPNKIILENSKADPAFRRTEKMA